MRFATSPRPLLEGDLVDDKYRVERVLGKGGMGIVVAARHIALDQLVAIKCMRLEALVFDDAAQRFMREARVVAKLRSENIAQVRDVGRLDDGSLFMVMEYLDGQDLSVLLKQRGNLDVTDAVDYLLQACAGVAEAHQCDIVHRDIKPANLFLVRRSARAPLIKVLDFGISKYRPPNADPAAATSPNESIGSPPFMSPEQARSAAEVDHRSDIWSLGVTLYALLSGRNPFTGRSAIEILYHVMNERHPPITESAPWVPEPLRQVLDRCMAKEPEQRYQRVSQLVSALLPFASASGRALATSQLRVSTVMSVQGAPVSAGGVEAAVGVAPSSDSSGPSATRALADERVALARTPSANEATHLVSRRPRRLVWLGGALALLLIIGGWLVLTDRGADDADQRDDTRQSVSAPKPVLASPPVREATTEPAGAAKSEPASAAKSEPAGAPADKRAEESSRRAGKRKRKRKRKKPSEQKQTEPVRDRASAFDRFE